VISGTPLPTLYPGRGVCSAARSCQDVGQWRTPRTQGAVFDKFARPYELDAYGVRVNCSYWTFWKPDRVRLWREPQHRDGAEEGERELFKAQVLTFQTRWLEGEDVANSPVNFVNFHLPIPRNRPLTLESRILHLQARSG
jgi:hypothetical protein